MVEVKSTKEKLPRDWLGRELRPGITVARASWTRIAWLFQVDTGAIDLTDGYVRGFVTGFGSRGVG